MHPIVLVLFLFALALYFYLRKGKKLRFMKYNLVGVGGLVVYVLYSIFACLLCFHPEFMSTSVSGAGTFSYEASIFLFAGLFICLLPFLKGGFSGFTEIKMCKELDYLYTILIICGIVEALLYIPYAVRGFTLMDVDMGTIREEGEELGGRVTHNFFLSKFVFIYDLFNIILPLGYFYYLTYTKKKKKANLIIIIYSIIPFLKTFTTGSRDNFVFPLITFIVTYLLLFPVVHKKTKKVINIVLGGFVGVVALISILMSYIRFEDSGLDPNFHVISYLGQGIVQFNCRMYDHIDIACYGDFNFAFYRKLLFLDYSANNEIRRTFWSTRLQYPTNIFYTHFGSYVIDFGKVGAFVFVIIVGIFVQFFTRVKGTVIRFSQLIILVLVGRIVFSGGFYFIDCAIFGGRRIFDFVILCLFLRVFKDS